MSAGPAVAALTGVPAGRIVDRFGAARTTVSSLHPRSRHETLTRNTIQEMDMKRAGVQERLDGKAAEWMEQVSDEQYRRPHVTRLEL